MCIYGLGTDQLPVSTKFEVLIVMSIYVYIWLGTDQLPVSTKFEVRNDPGVVRNYGRLLVELASVVPDGIVAFFVSYSYMDTIVTQWHEMGILQELMQHKLVFIETQVSCLYRLHPVTATTIPQTARAAQARVH
jgi:Rad3-related DNA helicase